MLTELATKRVFACFDGQNSFHTAKVAFGYLYPNYAPELLRDNLELFRHDRSLLCRTLRNLVCKNHLERTAKKPAAETKED